jgi:hypothetical protein
MFIPGFGIALGGFSAFSTGLVFNAIAQTSPALSNISPIPFWRLLHMVSQYQEVVYCLTN